MKIKPLEKHNGRYYNLAEVPEKINEIIELLNNSFITRERDESMLDVTDSLATIASDRLTPLSGETTCEVTFEPLLNIVEASRGIYDNVKCPKCGSKYFEVGPSCCTAVYYSTIVKDGVNMNTGRNKVITTYTCCECGHSWEE